MSEKVLSDNEVDALLDGVESGEIEVHSSQGPHYAAVTDFEVPRRSHIASKSFPQLELLNEKLAKRLKKRTQQLLHSDIAVVCSETVGAFFGDVCAQCADVLVAVKFASPPLDGHGALVFEPELVHQLVELFFGGRGGEPKEPANNGFTIGELRVVHAYADIVLESLREMWEPILAIHPGQEKTESAISLLHIAEDTDLVIKSTFGFSFAEHDSALQLILPAAMVESLLPVFKGTDRNADQAQDDMWSESIRDGLTDIDVELSSNVGHASMTLGELICLEPGDIITIDSPRIATVFANRVPLLEGRFGVHCGNNAVEASQWLSKQSNERRKEGTNG